MVNTRQRLKSWERFVALLAAAIVVALNVAATVQLFLQPSVFGYELTYTDGYRVALVDPGTAAASAGIVPGDHLDFTRSPLHDRIVALNYQPPLLGESVTFSVVRNGRAHPVTLRAAPLTAAESARAAFSPLAAFLRLAGFAYIAVALLILLRRPSRMTWGLFLYLLSATNVTLHHFPDWLCLLAQFASDLLSIAGPIGLVIFAVRFPNDRPTNWRRRLDRLAIPLGVLFAIPNLAWDGTALLLGWSPDAWMSLGSTLAALALILVAAATLTGTYFGAVAQERQRLLWVIVGVLMTLCSYASGWARYWSLTYPFVTSSAFVWLSAILYAIAPFAIAYAVVRQRVFDAAFIISRTVVYTFLTASIFALFTLVEWLVGSAVERTGVAVVLVAVSAVCVGFWLNSIHSKVDRFVERAFFWRRHQAERQLARIAAGLPYAENTDMVKDAIVREPAIVFALTSAALYKRDGTGNYVHDGDGKTLDAHISLQLQGERRSLRLNDFIRSNGSAATDDELPVLAVPIFVRSRLEAVAVYGAHITGEDIDPDELTSLEKVCAAAGIAYDYIETLRVTRELTRWRSIAQRQARQIASLRSTPAEGTQPPAKHGESVP